MILEEIINYAPLMLIVGGAIDAAIIILGVKYRRKLWKLLRRAKNPKI